jgi:hypothetical protein
MTISSPILAFAEEDLFTCVMVVAPRILRRAPWCPRALPRTSLRSLFERGPLENHRVSCRSATERTTARPTERDRTLRTRYGATDINASTVASGPVFRNPSLHFTRTFREWIHLERRRQAPLASRACREPVVEETVIDGRNQDRESDRAPQIIGRISRSPAPSSSPGDDLELS